MNQTQLIKLTKEAHDLCGRLSDAQLTVAWLQANRRMWRRLNQLKATGYNGPVW